MLLRHPLCVAPQSRQATYVFFELGRFDAFDVPGVLCDVVCMASFPAALAHGPSTRVADGVFAVRGGFRMGPGMTISRTMTVIVAGTGLIILNAMRLSDTAQAELDRLGKVTDLIKLSDSHGIDEPFYVDRHSATVWSLPIPAGKRTTIGWPANEIAAQMIVRLGTSLAIT
jgi:hypothetical protein